MLISFWIMIMKNDQHKAKIISWITDLQDEHVIKQPIAMKMGNKKIGGIS